MCLCVEWKLWIQAWAVSGTMVKVVGSTVRHFVGMTDSELNENGAIGRLKILLRSPELFFYVIHGNNLWTGSGF